MGSRQSIWSARASCYCFSACCCLSFLCACLMGQHIKVERLVPTTSARIAACANALHSAAPVFLQGHIKHTQLTDWTGHNSVVMEAKAWGQGAAAGGNLAAGVLRCCEAVAATFAPTPRNSSTTATRHPSCAYEDMLPFQPHRSGTKLSLVVHHCGHQHASVVCRALQCCDALWLVCVPPLTCRAFLQDSNCRQGTLLIHGRCSQSQLLSRKQAGL